jgi:hypothetical protein
VHITRTVGFTSVERAANNTASTLTSLLRWVETGSPAFNAMSPWGWGAARVAFARHVLRRRLKITCFQAVRWRAPSQASFCIQETAQKDIVRKIPSFVEFLTGRAGKSVPRPLTIG